MENHTQELLNQIDLGSQAGLSAIDDLRGKAGAKALESDFKHMRQGYQNMQDKARNLMQNKNIEPKEVGMLGKAGMWLSSNLQTMMDDSTHHVASMMIDGCNMGIKSTTQVLNQEGGDEDARKLAESFVRQQQENIESLKQHL